MRRIFLDDSVLFAAVFLPSPLRWLLKSLEDATLVTSLVALEEVKLNLQRRIDTCGRKRLEHFAKGMEIVTASPPRTTINENDPGEGISGSLSRLANLPVGERHALASAIHAKATHFLTGDFTRFGDLMGRSLGGVLILRPVDYLQSAGWPHRKPFFAVQSPHGIPVRSLPRLRPGLPDRGPVDPRAGGQGPV